MTGLIALLILLLYISIARVTYKLLVKKISRLKAFLLTAVVFLLIPYWDYIPNRIYFYNLCDREAGQRIYKTVTERGYYYNGYVSGCRSLCVDALSKSNKLDDDTYLFMQTYVRFARKESLSPTKGYYQFSIEDKGSELCHLFEQHYKVNKLDYSSLPTGKCVGSKKIDKPTVKYEYVRDSDYVSGSNIVRSYTLIKSIESDEVISGAYSFSYLGGWMSKLISPLRYKITNHLHCYKGDAYPNASSSRDIIPDTFTVD